MGWGKYFLLAGLITLIAILTIPGVAASDSTQPGYITVGSIPVAQFSAQSAAYATVPTSVSFTDSSLGSKPMTCEWDFGDGAASTDQNPTHTYLQRGTYTVTLTVKNAYGTSTAIKKDYISVGVAPRADFIANQTTGNAPLSVAFTDTSTGIITAWAWDFGDGTGSTGQNPAHTYWTAGVYTVTLTTSNDYGTWSCTKNQYITVASNLVSKFSADPASGKAPLSVRFTDRSLGNPTSWNWNFGDGTRSAEQHPSHTFTTSGVYTVNLMVTRGTDSEISLQIINVGGVPRAEFAGYPRSASVGDLIEFTDISSNTPTSWTWDFGDTATSTLENPIHSYQQKGVYTISLTAQNPNGKGTETKTGYINIGVGPTAEFMPVIAPYVVGKIPMSVDFIDRSIGLPATWYWDFGDGTNATDENPTHSYQTAGIYTVSLTVKNAFGTDTKVSKDLINVGEEGVVDFTAGATTVGPGWVVSFTDRSTIAPTQWNWDFGDGTTGSGPKPDHAYDKTGVYDVTLHASSPTLAGSTTKTGYITVLNIPHADFVADKTRGGAPMTVTFTDKSSNSPVSWNWDFGDGATSPDQNPDHTYTTLGSYTVTLTASNADGQDSTSKAGYIITTLAPVAAFSADRQLGNAPFIVHFTDLSNNNPTSWNWDFGDGTSSSEQNPRHIYPSEGSYNVRLTATNQYGSDTAYTGSLPQGTTASVTAAQATENVTADRTITPGTVGTGVTTSYPGTTRTPLPAAVSVIAMGIAVLAIISARQK